MSTASDPDVLLRAVHSSVLQLPSEQCDSWLEIYQCSEDELVDSTRRALVKRSAMWTPEHREVIVVAIQDFLRSSVNAVSAWMAIRRVDERVFVSILSQSVRSALYLLPSGEDRPKAALDASDALLRGGGKYVDQDRCEAEKLKSWNAARDICYGHRSQLLGPHAVFKVAEDVVRRPRSNTTRQKKLVRDARAAVVAYAAYYAATEVAAREQREACASIFDAKAADIERKIQDMRASVNEYTEMDALRERIQDMRLDAGVAKAHAAEIRARSTVKQS